MNPAELLRIVTTKGSLMQSPWNRFWKSIYPSDDVGMLFLYICEAQFNDTR